MSLKRVANDRLETDWHAQLPSRNPQQLSLITPALSCVVTAGFEMLR